MSKSTHKERTEAQAHRSQKRSQSEISHAVDQIDHTLTRLQERIIPPQPYLLSVPSDVPYRHSSRFINTWHIGTPFSAEEEQLQYLSFLSHQGEEDSLLKVVGGWADEKGNLLEDEVTSPASLSGQNTPIEQSGRKKISLKDYKTKDKTRPSTPTTKTPAQELRKQVMKSEAKEHAVKVEEGMKGAMVSGKPKIKNETRGSPMLEKLKAESVRSPRPSTDSRKSDLQNPAKRRRFSSDSPKRETTPPKSEKSREADETKGLPSLLSPTLPAQQKERSRKALPGLLAPDLPPALEKLLAKVDGISKPESTSTPRTEPVKSILGTALGSAAGKRLPDKSAKETDVNRLRSDSQNSSSKPGIGTPKIQSPAITPALKSTTRPVTPLPNGASPKPRQRHIVALKYGKKNRKRVDGLLKLTSRPKKVKPVADEPLNKVVEPRPISTKPVSEPDKSERKRPAEPSPERPAKKMKQLETPEKTKLSNVTAAKSPAGPSVQRTKPEPATPQKELKSSAMRRIESQDGGDARTPQGDRGRTSTPINASGSMLAKASPGLSSSLSREERNGWQEMNVKYFALGRTLKHEGTSLGPSPGADRSEKDQALSVILLIEALLCFMINQAALSQARPTIDPGWSTILPYHNFVWRASQKYRPLHGLVIQLGAICRQLIHNHDIERLARDPLPFEHCESAPTPGSDGTTRQNDDVEKYKTKYMSFRDQLVQNARALQKAWLEGSRYLSPTTIERDYPKTWAKRTKDTSRRGSEKPKPDAIGREYFLPLDSNSTAFEASRFSLSFLREWSEKEKVDWKPKVEL